MNLSNLSVFSNMSSTSIARQNRRMRIRQNISALDLGTKQTNMPMKLNPAKKMINTSVSNSLCGKSNYAPKSYEIEPDSYSTLSYAASCDFLNGNIVSQPVEKIFIEGDRAFKEISASEIFQLSQRDITVQTDCENELFINSAFKIANYFHSFSNFSHGLLGGLSLFYLLVLLHLFSDLLVDEDTAQYFIFFSKPIHNLFNFLCIICCVSVFDRIKSKAFLKIFSENGMVGMVEQKILRPFQIMKKKNLYISKFDITNTAELFKLLKKLHFKLITLLIYPTCLLLSLSTANIDEKLSTPNQNESIWESLNFKEDSELYYWKTLSLSKCFGALLGWMVLCPDQNFNLFFDHMRNILQRRMPQH